MSNRRRRHETPRKRTYPSGKVVWLARYTGLDGKHRIAKPDWNGGKGTFDKKVDAQRAIDEAYDSMYYRAPEIILVGDFAATWTQRYPRSKRTNDTNDYRVGVTLDIDVEGRPFRDWPIIEIRRRHVLALVDHMLRVHGRATTGAVGVVRSLSAMFEDAITDELTEINAAQGVKVKANDVRATKQRRRVRVFSFEQMHRFASFAGQQEGMVRVLSDDGLRLGELLPLERADLILTEGKCADEKCRRQGVHLHVVKTAHEGAVLPGTKNDHGEPDAGRTAPIAPSTLAVIRRQPARIDTPLLFATPTGKLWRERNFYRDVWYPTQERHGEVVLAERGVELPDPVPEGLNLRQNAKAVKERLAKLRALLELHELDWRPHEFRHSWITNLRAAGVDDADLAETGGHTVETMIGHYAHPLGLSDEKIRGLIG